MTVLHSLSYSQNMRKVNVIFSVEAGEEAALRWSQRFRACFVAMLMAAADSCHSPLWHQAAPFVHRQFSPIRGSEGPVCCPSHNRERWEPRPAGFSPSASASDKTTHATIFIQHLCKLWGDWLCNKTPRIQKKIT